MAKTDALSQHLADETAYDYTDEADQQAVDAQTASPQTADTTTAVHSTGDEAQKTTTATASTGDVAPTTTTAVHSDGGDDPYTATDTTFHDTQGDGKDANPQTDTTATTNTTEEEQMMHDEIARLLAKGHQPVTYDDVAAQYEPLRVQYQREEEAANRQNAEAAAFQGTNVGGAGGPLDAERNSLHEELAQKEGTALASQMHDEIAARRADIVNALQFAQGDQKIQLQKELQDTDAQLRQRALDLQKYGIDTDAVLRQRQIDLQKYGIDVDKYLRERGLDLQKYGIDINAELTKRGLDLTKLDISNKDKQFYDRLAYDIAHDNLTTDQIIQRFITGK